MKYPGKNQYAESYVTDYKGVPSQNNSKAYEAEKIAKKEVNNATSAVVPTSERISNEVSNTGSVAQYTKK